MLTNVFTKWMDANIKPIESRMCNYEKEVAKLEEKFIKNIRREIKDFLTNNCRIVIYPDLEDTKKLKKIKFKNVK